METKISFFCFFVFWSLFFSRNLFQNQILVPNNWFVLFSNQNLVPNVVCTFFFEPKFGSKPTGVRRSCLKLVHSAARDKKFFLLKSIKD